MTHIVITDSETTHKLRCSADQGSEFHMYSVAYALCVNTGPKVVTTARTSEGFERHLDQEQQQLLAHTLLWHNTYQAATRPHNTITGIV